jgi:hypothetical protein
VAASAVSFAFFDAFSFPLLAGLTFLVLGMVGAMHQLTIVAPSEDTSRTPTDARTTSQK